MRLAVVQMPLVEDLRKNEKRIEGFLEEAVAQNVGLVGFPEMALTSYACEILGTDDLNERVETSLSRLQNKCRVFGIGIIIGHGWKVDGKLLNRATVLLPDGRRFAYDKINLTAAEAKCFTPGQTPLVFEHERLKVGVIICRDQNYPLLARELRDAGAQAMFILSAHYYKPREARWKVEKNRAIPITRAVENGMHVLLSGTVGTHLGLTSLGNSLIADPSGCVVVSANESDATLLTVEVSEGT